MSFNLRFRQSVQAVNDMLSTVDVIFASRSGSTPSPPLFIIGPPRCGSTLTYQLVTQYFQTGYMTAPLAYGHGLANLLCRLLKPWLGRPKAVFKSNYGHTPGFLAPSEHAHFWYQWFPEDGEMGHYLDPESVILDSYSDLRHRLDSLSRILDRPLVFKNLYLSMCAGALARILPQARFLLVRRDPLLVYQSVLRGRECQAKADWWSVKPPHYHEWLKLPIWQQVARQVFYADAIPRRDLLRYAPERFLELDYPELCSRPFNSLERLSSWLEPVGYKTYSELRIPRQFKVSDKLSLEPEHINMVRKELDILGRQFDAKQF